MDWSGIVAVENRRYRESGQHPIRWRICFREAPGDPHRDASGEIEKSSALACSHELFEVNHLQEGLIEGSREEIFLAEAHDCSGEHFDLRLPPRLDVLEHGGFTLG